MVITDGLGSISMHVGTATPIASFQALSFIAPKTRGCMVREGPFSRMQIGGGEEGVGYVRAVTDGPVSATEQPGEAETQDEGSDDGVEQPCDEHADLLADFDRAFDEARDDMRMRDSIESIGSVLREIYRTSCEEDEEEENVAAQTHIDSVAEQIALGDTGDRTEMIEDTRQLE
jgi:hypothetical protein